MLHYILQTLVFQMIFLIIYDTFLKRETFFNWNRFYLLGTSILSILLPFIKIDGLKNVVPEQYIIALPEIVLGQNNTAVIDETSFNLMTTPLWKSILFLGVFIMALLLLFKIVRLVVLIYKSPKVWKKNLIIVNLLDSNAAYSFFHFVFLGEQIRTADKDSILSHELVHVREKHTLDLLFFEVLRVLFWFNPLVYMYQNRVASLHEFIADEKASKDSGTKYYENLLAQVFNVNHSSIINPFFKESLIKKRIIMLSKSKSKKLNLIKYTFLLPILVCMLIYTSCSQQDNAVESLDSDTEEVIEKFRGQLETENSNLSKEERLEIAEKIIEQFNANVESSDHAKIKGYFKNENFDGKDEVPFAAIDESPIFPNCENDQNQKQCFSKSMTQHVGKNFNVNLGKSLGLTGAQRIFVAFKIDKSGNVVDVKARAPHPELEKEVKRVMALLPKMTPGKQNGKIVTVPYSLPIKFKINE